MTGKNLKNLKMNNDELGDRLKGYEKRTQINLLSQIPVIGRVDGRCFHSFVRGLERPYDKRLVDCMRQTAIQVADETSALLAYTQSDEITFLWYQKDYDSEIWFNGKHSKMVSQLAALTTLFFYKNCEKYLPEYCKKNPSFDARVFQVPTKAEACNVFLWRELDATRNSVSMAARSVYSHKQLDGQGRADMMDMLMEKGINWNDYPAFFKRGSYIKRVTESKQFSKEDLEKLPENHEARSNPDMIFRRSYFDVIDVPIFSKIENKVDFIFNGHKPMEAFEREYSCVFVNEKS